ncbi:MAG: hypothetical protein SPL79_11515 [Sphaerochaetaceae bacterium]|nr:hypothetical protein [Sphaerochaetaceae bacterium]
MGTKTIAEANLYNDVLFLFSCYGNTAMTGPILGIMLGQPVKMRSFTPQNTLGQRTRYNAASLDAHMLRKGQPIPS